jgi:hypothetical protein
MWFVKLQAADLVLSVVDRARALGRPHDSGTLLTAYRERERSLLAAELKADIVAPMLLTSLDLEHLASDSEPHRPAEGRRGTGRTGMAPSGSGCTTPSPPGRTSRRTTRR